MTYLYLTTVRGTSKLHNADHCPEFFFQEYTKPDHCSQPVGFPSRKTLQENSTFLVVAFPPDANPSDVPPVYGNVTPLGDGSYNVSYVPTYADT